MNRISHIRPRLEGCKDYPLFQAAFSESILDCFEDQLNEYLKLEEISEDYLRNVPRIVSWFEGLIPTADLVEELGTY